MIVVRNQERSVATGDQERLSADYQKKLKWLKAWNKSRAKAIKKYQSKPKKPRKIRLISIKRRKQLDQYYILSEQYLIDNPDCQAKLKGCVGIAEEIHHMQGRSNELLLDTRYFKGVCGSCHIGITEHSAQAIQDGHSKSRHKI